MKIRAIGLFLTVLSGATYANSSNDLPTGFVYLEDVAPSIMQDMRYASDHNFVGHSISGYQSARCILTVQAADALQKIQTQLRKSNLSLKVYDCYRPQMASDAFLVWSQDIDDQAMKAEFYPRINKADFFKLGYVAAHSSHSRGSTVDLTIVPVPTPREEIYQPGQPLEACYASYNLRYHDNSIDMGTGYDCMDKTAILDSRAVTMVAQHNRQLLSQVMQDYGFKSYDKEWWHFTLKNEPFPNTYYNFPVQ